MNYNEFQALPQDKQALVLKQAMATASAFEVLRQDPKTSYRNLAKILHPDNGGDGAAFSRLHELKTQADAEIAAGDYGVTAAKAQVIDNMPYPLLRKLGEGDFADVWLTVDNSIVKIARDDNDSDFLANEVTVLTKLADSGIPLEDTVPHVGPHFESATVLYFNEDTLPAVEKLFTLEQLAQQYENDIPERAIGWIWRRMLGSLVVPHYIGITHAGFTPDNFLIANDDETHRGILIGWGHAVLNGSPLTSVQTKWEALYPQDVLNGMATSPRMDIYMAAQSMLWSAKNLPAQMKVYFEGMTGKYGRIPYNPTQLLQDWDAIMYQQLGWKKEWVPLEYIDNQIDFDWFS